MENAAGTPYTVGSSAPFGAAKPNKSASSDTLFSRLENKESLIKTVLARAKYAADYRRPFEEEWHNSFLAMFQVFSSPMEASWESQRYMPLILSNVETAHSVIGSVVVDTGKICRFQGKSPEGRDAARAHEELLDAQNKGKVKIARAIFGSEWWALVTGTGIVDTGWEWQEGERIVPIVRDGVKSMIEKRVVMKDHPYVREVNPLDYYLCPHSGYGKNHEWVVVLARCTLGEIREAAGKGHIDKAAFEEWEKTLKPTDGKPDRHGFFRHLGPRLLDRWLQEVGKSNPDDQPPDDEDELTDDKLVEVLVYRSKTEIITLGSPEHLIGYSKNPHKHGEVGIVTNPYLEIKGCPYGRGLAGILLGHQQLLNMNVNLFADVMMVSMMRPMIVDKSLISILDDELIFEPNALLRAKMNAREAVIPLDVPAPTNLFLMWDAHIKKDADDTGGFTEQSRGIAPTNSPTATEFSGVQANIQNRLKKHVLNLKWFVEDVCSLVKELNEQYMTEPEVVTVVGDDGIGWRKIEPWELVGEVICQATTSPKFANQDLHVQRQLQLIQVVMPILQSGQINPPMARMLRNLLRAANTEDIDLILPSGMETVKSPEAENEYMLRGGRPTVTVAEIRSGQGGRHIQSHQQFLQALAADDSIPQSVIAIFSAHIEEHMQKEQQFGIAAAAVRQQGQQPPLPPGMQGGGDQDRQAATALGSSQGATGVPGAASPGPVAPPGRPMGM